MICTYTKYSRRKYKKPSESAKTVSSSTFTVAHTIDATVINYNINQRHIYHLRQHNCPTDWIPGPADARHAGPYRRGAREQRSQVRSQTRLNQQCLLLCQANYRSVNGSCTHAVAPRSPSIAHGYIHPSLLLPRFVRVSFLQTAAELAARPGNCLPAPGVGYDSMLSTSRPQTRRLKPVIRGWQAIILLTEQNVGRTANCMYT